MTGATNRAAQKKRAATAAAIAALPPASQHDLEQKLGHVFADPTILLEALQAAGNGVSEIGDRKICDGNKRLAMLGDSVLQLAVLMDWFKDGESRRSGHSTLVSVACNRNLHDCGKISGLSAFINKGNIFANGVIPRRTMSATVEALIGAVFLDSGESLEAVKVAMGGLGLL